MRLTSFFTTATQRNNLRWGRKRLAEIEQIQPITPEFDATTDEEIEALAASVGASGARRPPSE